MKKMSKPLSITLVILLALSMLTVCASAQTVGDKVGSDAEAAGAVTVTSNISEPIVVEYNDADEYVTVTYMLQSSYSILNTQSYLSYDPGVLELESADAETNLPRLSTGQAMLNTSIDGKVYISASKYNYYSFKTARIYYTQTFRIVGSGNTTVHLQMEVLTGTDQTDYNTATGHNDILLVNYDYIEPDSFTFTANAELTDEIPVPTEEPTTVEPTTVEPTTVEPTTVEPTTVEPTTVEPTTVEPTTVEPTTVEPTTVEPTTVAPTTVPVSEVVDRDGALIVGDDFNLLLTPAGKTGVVGEIYLPAGSYPFRVQKERVLMGYNATINDSTTKGLTFNAKFKAKTTLVATGGVYRFQFNKEKNALIISKKTDEAPKAYLTGDIHTVLNAVQGNDGVAVGSAYLPAGSYDFKVVNGTSECGYNKTFTDTSGSGMFSLNPKYKANLTLIATGGMYTFTLHTKTNKLKVGYFNDSEEAKDDIHITGDINLELIEEGEGEAVGTVTLPAGTYTFKVYNFGVIYTIGLTFNDTGKKILKNTYTAPASLNATGGTYIFTFNKLSGVLEITKAGEGEG